MELNNGIIRKYEKVLEDFGINNSISEKRTNQIIRKSLHTFCMNHKNPAIWCFGKHTRMLMADFMNEMKNIKFIIDSSMESIINTGFYIIHPTEIEKNEIDGIIISSYLYKDEIKADLKRHHKTISYLDIYEKLQSEGIVLKSSYFSASHPYSRYQVLNELQVLYQKSFSKESRIKYLKRIIENYVVIKDFQSAIKYTTILSKITNSSRDKMLLENLKILYELEKEQISKIDSENVLMLCIDGLRRQDLLGGKLPKLLSWIRRNGYFFENAYSSSTSTYESLMPVYSSNNDMRTEYYKKNLLSESECPFLNKAREQNRKIFFYTDTDLYIDCEEINANGYSQTITEKMWDYMKDANGENNGLFYIHILYESHYSYVNPYTEEPLIADGSNIMFDFLDVKGGKLRTDYVKQQNDALHYIDDILSPFLEQITCRIVFYSDHGNILLNKADNLESLDEQKYSCHKDLIEIPMVIKCPELLPQSDQRIISLMGLNDIICCLLEKKTYEYVERPYIKVQRSRIYNPDFQYLYKKYGKKRELQAFELFIFFNGIHLIVYENGEWEIIRNEQNISIDKDSLYQSIIQDITVCNKTFKNQETFKE